MTLFALISVYFRNSFVGNDFSSLNISRLTRALDLRNTAVRIHNKTFEKLSYIGKLDLSYNNIAHIDDNTFAVCRNLRSLNLAFNRLRELTPLAFIGLINLEKLILTGNHISSIWPMAFQDLPRLPLLELQNNKFGILHKGVFTGLVRLKTLDLSNSSINTLEDGVFDNLLITKLNISLNDIKHYNKDDFDGLKQLLHLHSDDYKFCCFVNILEENCLPAKNELSSCEDLMTNNILRSFLWIIALLSMLGNAGVIVSR